MAGARDGEPSFVGVQGYADAYLSACVSCSVDLMVPNLADDLQGLRGGGRPVEVCGARVSGDQVVGARAQGP